MDKPTAVEWLIGTLAYQDAFIWHKEDIFNHALLMEKNQNKSEMTFDNGIANVTQWAQDKGLLEPENAPKQMLKVMEEVGETASAILKNDHDKIVDGIGDSFVTLIVLSKQLGLEPSHCLEVAWNEIKDRKGKMVGGTFIKNLDCE